ncbi:MAG TPA: hypothetical protein VJU61_25315 [Polyangiaceae bacterium]|nr:hypothetical protein [Polyangiaceae bacterium]
MASGTFTGVAQLLATSSSVTSARSTTTLRSDGGWQDLTLDVGDAPRPSLGFDPAQIVAFGLQFHVGPNLGLATRGLVVFQIDSFSLESPPDPRDAGR